MKYIILAVLLTGFAHAETSEAEITEIEVGAPQDCVVLEKTEDQKKLGPQRELQQLITDCLSPEEHESKTQTSRTEVVSQ